MGPRPHHQPAGQDGFTIIEVMVAMIVLTIGVLGTFVLLEGSLTSTRATTQREQGTNLARELIERSRQLPYASTAYDVAPAQIRATLPDAGVLNGSSFTVVRRGTTYTVSLETCSIDDASDGVGVIKSGACAAPTGPSTPGTPSAGVLLGTSVLGVSVTAAGSLIQTVCNALGPGSTILTQVNALVSSITPLSACTNTAATAPYDSRPDDLRRVRATVTWTQGARTRTLNQTTFLTNPLPNNCPATTPVAPDTLPAGCPTPTS